MTGIAELIHRVARGKHGAKDLNRDEARTVFSALLQPDVDILQLGAFLIAERMKGTSASELAGFVDAARSCVHGFGIFAAPVGTIDLPCYAGKRRAVPLHLAAALRAKDEGLPVFVHGVAHIEGRVTAWQALRWAGVKQADDLRQATEILTGDGIVYMDIADICPDLSRVLELHPRLGVRSFAHTVVRMLNPLRCIGQLNGMFHTPYARHMAEANALLGQHRSLIFMGAEGEPELYASRQKALLLQQKKDIRPLRYPDADVEAYPKEEHDRPDDMEMYISVRRKVWADRREMFVLRRMHEAFQLVSAGTLPKGWHEHIA